MDGNNGDVQFWKQLYQIVDPARRPVLIKSNVDNDQTGFIVADCRIKLLIFLIRNREVLKARSFKPPLYLPIRHIAVYGLPVRKYIRELSKFRFTPVKS